MCGLAGYVGIPQHARLDLVEALGYGIDDRGGHAAGFVSVSPTNKVYHGRRIGMWTMAKKKFARRAALGETCLMHARWATCGKKDAESHAHPFEIRRFRTPVLWGAHNGIIWGAEKSARLNGRDYTVDSRELFELLADDDLEAINDLDGYGVITWIDAEDHKLYFAKLASQAEFCVCQIVGGGVAWASTWDILSYALEYAGLEADFEYEPNEIGRVYRIDPDGVYKTDRTNVKLDDGPEWSRWNFPESWKEYMAERDFREGVESLEDEIEDEDKDVPPAVDEYLRSTWERDSDDPETPPGGYPSIARSWYEA